MPEIKEGKDTTEYQEAKSAKVWAIIGVVLGFVLQIGGAVIEALDGSGTAAIIGGAVLQALVLLNKTLVQLGYIKSRADVKVSANGPNTLNTN